MLTRNEWLFLGSCALVWVVVGAQLPPGFASTDVYLFRDAACNLASGHGFRTASFEHSHSFVPVLYSSYTPGSLWLFALPARAFGCTARLGEICSLFWALLADVVVVFAGFNFAPRGPVRWVVLLSLGTLLPFGFMNGDPDRPESVAFVVLVVLLVVQRRSPTWRNSVVSGFLGGVAFLVEPFAGVLAMLLIAGWLLAFGFERSASPVQARSNAGAMITDFLLKGALAVLFFGLPITLTALGFYEIDHSSLERFWEQATVAGISRTVNYHAGELHSALTETNVPRHVLFLSKYRQAALFHWSLGPIHMWEMLGCLAVGGIWVLLLLRSVGKWRAQSAMMIAGFACFMVPLLVFPLQGNYLTLARALFPAVLASNWATIRSGLRSTAVIPVLIIINFIAVIPEAGIRVLTLAESRSSYDYARVQADNLAEYLRRNPLDGKVILVPSTHYYLYKEIARDIYNPAYLSGKESPDSVAAVVNCYTSTEDFLPGTLPLPSFVAQRQWRMLSAAHDSLHVSLLHHVLMRRNWGMGCDIYVLKQ